MIAFKGMPNAEAQRLWQGGADAHGNPPEQQISDGEGNPCRHCLQMIAKGEAFLIVSHKPFSSTQPYAEQGPVFLHADPCKAFESTDVAMGALPPVLEDSDAYLLRGYDHNERIVYGTGAVTAKADIHGRAEDLFGRQDIQFVHVRSASNNCWQARIDRSADGE